MKGKKIILGITGSIAAYKAASLIRLFIKEGAEVQVVMTPLAKEFITPLTLATLSRRPILVEFFNPENGNWNSHVDLGLWADAYLIAPATANTMAKMANGIADNLLLTTYLSARYPVFIAPAMDLDMYRHDATQNNINILSKRGVTFIEPESGELASGLIGKGRMAEPETIVNQMIQFFQHSKLLSGKCFMVTAGPTYEAIDPVRFIGNFSSGKMGYAIAETLADFGAEVILISGPTSLNVTNKSITRINVTSAEQMYNAAIQHFETCDGAVLSAAVADYTPVESADKKIKSEKTNIAIHLKPTKDIAAELGKQKRDNQLLVGFALETHNEIENAIQKIKKKNLDFIVLNSLNDKNAGFQHDTNKITIIDRSNNTENFELKTKKEVAKDIVEKIVNQYKTTCYA